MESVPPLFIKDRDIGCELTPLQMCNAIVRVIGVAKLDGVQRINNLWRLYVKERAARLELYIKETLLINNKHVPLYDQNPHITNQLTPRKKNDKLTVKNIPLSVSNSMIEDMLVQQNVVLTSTIRYGYIRDEDGNLTGFKSGDRFLYVEAFDPPIPRHQEVGMFPCIVIHHGKMMACIACGQTGHKVGDEQCAAKPVEDIVAFKSFQHPLSNHFPCQLKIYDLNFKSLEHAYFWRMASEMGKPELAEQIKNARHAGEAKRLSKEIAADEVRWQWEMNNTDTMQMLLDVKAEQCEQFKICLMENQGKLLAEATPSKFWATGLSPYITQHTAPQYWPGQNMLGALLMELSRKLITDISSQVPPLVN